MNRDLQYIALQLTEWPSNELTIVRLDADGEICFEQGTTAHDFYPEDTEYHFITSPHPDFVPSGSQGIGHEYTRQEWEQARTELLNQKEEHHD